MTDHHFSRTDLATLVGGLDRAGIPFIEVGHGMGFGRHVWKDPARRAAALPLPLLDDTAHAEVACRVAKRAKIGCLMVAGHRNAPIEYIDRIAELGLSFVRLASMPDEVNDDLFAYVRRIKDRGMIASINMMQTYVQPPELVGELAARAADHGLDWFYVVDSAGGMMVDDVKRYVTSILSKARVEVGLHAHNNTGCAMANALAAVDAGATLVDGTLNGIGRATGNSATEQLAVTLRDRMDPQLDLDALVVLGNAVRSLFDDTANNSFDFISGGALVHSRNIPQVERAAGARDRSRASFVIAVGQEAKRRGELSAINFSEALLDAAAASSAPIARAEPSEAMAAVVTEEILSRWRGGARRAIEELHLRKQQRHRTSVVHVSRGAVALCTQPVPWQFGGQAGVMGVTIPWAEGSPSWDIGPEHLPDFVLVDGTGELPLEAKHPARQISFADVYARAVQDVALALSHRGITLWRHDGDDDQLGALPRSNGARPASAVAVVLGANAASDATLTEGDVAIMTGSPQRARVDALRRRGIRVLAVQWASAVAQLAHRLSELDRELDTDDSVKDLVSGIHACGVGQSTWDPDHATLLDAENPTAAAKTACTAWFDAIFAQRRRL